MRNLRTYVVAVAVLGAICASYVTAAETDFPTRPIKLVVAQSPGAAADALARILADRMGPELGQPVVVENKTGGNTVVAALAVAKANPDGYTILELLSSNVVVTLLQANPLYDLQKDFAPVIGIGSVPHALAVPTASKIRSIPDLVAASKASSGIAYGSGGVGSMSHMAGALLNQELKLNATHVPFRGLAPVYTELLANRIQFAFPSTVDAISLAKSGDVTLLAVTSEERVPLLPDIPTTKELGLGQIDPKSSYGFLVPAKTPQAIVDKLYKAFAKAVADPAVQEKLRTFSFTTKIQDGPEFGKSVAAELGRWQKVIDTNHIKGQE